MSIRKRFSQDSKGSIALYVILCFSIILPMLIFVAVDLPYAVNFHRKLKNTLDNAASSAVLCLNETELAYNRIVLEEACVEEVVYKMLAYDLRLHSGTLDPLEGSYLTEKPTLVIRVINEPETRTQVRLPDQDALDGSEYQDIYLDETGVAIYFEMKLNGIFFNAYHPVIKHATSAQSRFGTIQVPIVPEEGIPR